MPTTDQQRHRMISRAVRRRSDAQTDVNVKLWNSLAAELCVLIGVRGFGALYIRSLYCASAAFPWMVRPIPETPPNAFKLVEFSLNTSDAAEAQAAHAALLNIFTDTLIIIIGEALTNNILRKAWGDDVVDIVGTESRS